MVRRAVAEALGTAFLLAAVVGSGIMGERLAGGNVAIALLANTIATGAMLVALILTFGPISGAHFNPAVTLADASQGGLAWRDVPIYIAAQIVGAFAGVAFRSSDVRRAAVFCVEPHPGRQRPTLQRICCDVRSALCDLGLRANAVFRRAIRGRRLHHRSLLVHLIDFLRQSGGHIGPCRFRHVRGHPAGRRAGIYRGAVRRGHGGNIAFPVAYSAHFPIRGSSGASA